MSDTENLTVTWTGLPARRRPRGDERERLRAVLAEGYRAGASIRALAEQRELSFGLTRVLLLEAGVTLRQFRAPKQ